jgi:hypothetical protein
MYEVYRYSMSIQSLRKSVSNWMELSELWFLSSQRRHSGCTTECKHVESDIEPSIDDSSTIWHTVEVYDAYDREESSVESYFVETGTGFHEYTDVVYVVRCLGCGTTARVIRGEKCGCVWKKHMSESAQTEFRKTHSMKCTQTCEKQVV